MIIIPLSSILMCTLQAETMTDVSAFLIFADIITDVSVISTARKSSNVPWDWTNWLNRGALVFGCVILCEKKDAHSSCRKRADVFIRISSAGCQTGRFSPSNTRGQTAGATPKMIVSSAAYGGHCLAGGARFGW